ncbi:MAG: helix-turn-helix domain-containing protein [Actinomycetota bacterium]|nr:helix-turn-helix domain-containing protein [Actinomycetota bacterium]
MSLATPAPVATPSISVGELLRSWRRRRRLSQLELALDATVSARHVSFLETGRARPSREMLLHLAEHLEVPLRERNGLLLAAGFAPLYDERSLDSEEMAPVRQALDRFLRAHEPYPALVIDRHHSLLAANDAVATLTAGVSPELLEPPANALRVALHPQGMAPRTVNLGEWSAHLLERLRREARITGDATLDALYDELASYPGVELLASREAVIPAAEIVVPLRLRDDAGEEHAFFSTIATFGTAVDVTLAEVSVEAFYPANARTAMRLLGDVGATP